MSTPPHADDSLDALLAASERSLASDPAKALDFAQRALASLSHDDIGAAARCHCQIGTCLLWLEQFAAAMTTLRRAQEMAHQASLLTIEARCMNNIGVLYFRLGDAITALEFYESALALRRQVGDQPGMAAALHNIGIQRRELGDAAGALVSYQEALQMDRLSGDRQGEGRTIVSVGVAHFVIGESAQAEPAYREGLAIALEVDDQFSAAQAHNNLAELCMAQRRFDEALQQNEAARVIAHALVSAELIVRTVATQGQILHRAGRLPEARAALEQASALALQAGKKHQAVGVDRELTTVLESLGEAGAALTAMKRAFATEQELKAEENNQRLRVMELRKEVEQARAAAATQHARALSFEALAHQDALTGLANRRWFDTRAPMRLARASADATPLCLAVLDVDHFKRVNDGFSHSIGDAVLAEIGALLRGAFRGGDECFRYGGEEFVLLLDRVSLEMAQTLCERLRVKVEQHDWPGIAPELHITLSIGLAQAIDSDTAHSLFARADLALYRAKDGGRNRVVA
jgi:diguanylate cyclase (GGDEF)-like protein